MCPTVAGHITQSATFLPSIGPNIMTTKHFRFAGDFFIVKIVAWAPTECILTSIGRAYHISSNFSSFT